ncbi:MAG: peptidoglycan DD-metalloendopeptidase family protein [Polyangiales bacterium]
MSAVWCWPLPGVSVAVLPAAGAPGAFGAVRRHDVHTGVDLHCGEGQAVHAVEDGVVVGVEDFTGPAAGSSWWLPTKAVLVEGASGVVLYGEVVPEAAMVPGALVAQGDRVGRVTRVLRHDKGAPTTMLHLELYAAGARSSVWWRHGEPQPAALRDPTAHLRAVG